MAEGCSAIAKDKDRANARAQRRAPDARGGLRGPLLAWALVGAAACLTTVDTFSESLWPHPGGWRGPGLHAFAGPVLPNAPGGRARPRVDGRGDDARGRCPWAHPRARAGARAACAGATTMGAGVRMAGFISGLRARLRGSDVRCQATARGQDEFEDDEIGALGVYDVRLNGSNRRRVLWDQQRGRLFTVSVDERTVGAGSQLTANEFMRASTDPGGAVRSPAQAWGLLVALVKQSFLPRGVTSDYYAFTLWRMAQRVVSSTVSVFGTQSLLMALGVKTNKVGVGVCVCVCVCVCACA